MATDHLDITTLENWLWDAACTIRGPVDAPKYKDYILPLIFLKRLSDAFEDEVQRLQKEFGDLADAAERVEADHGLVRMYIPKQSRWTTISTITAGLGQALTDAVRGVSSNNPSLSGVIDVTDFNATTAGQRMVSDEQLHELVQVLSKHRLGFANVEPDILGRAYEYLLRKFAEGQGQSAGEFYTPRAVGELMARLLDPEPGQSVYDPACGSSGLLIKCHLRLVEKLGESKNGSKQLPATVAPLKVFGQEVNPTTYAMSRMNAFIHDIDAQIAVGDTIRRPAFKSTEGKLQEFDVVTANPMWNQDFPSDIYENDPFDRFKMGAPPASSGDWGWLQHMVASLKPGGRIAVVLDTGAVSRGSGNQGSNRERDIRKAFIEKDWIEAVILLPENLFYNTTAPGIIVIVNQSKSHESEVLLVNASPLFVKGRPKNELTEEHVAQISKYYADWDEEEGIAKVISLDEAAKNDFNLSPSRYVAQNDEEPVLPLEEAVVLLREAEEERVIADAKLNEVLRDLGLLD